ncbi:MAG: alpha-amylase, partial [Anaerolineae bacterium]|nr:alpha-amylase [Anaerolineae bacterium]
MKRHRFMGIVLWISLIIFGMGIAGAQSDDQPQSVTIIGTIQSALGCPGDWQPECEATQLMYDADDDLWYASFDLPAGKYEYKAALNGTLDENYGANAEPNGGNIPLSLSEDTTLTFFYSHTAHWVTDDVNSIIANVPGNYQDEIGCPGEWQPDCLRSWLQDPDGDGIYVFATGALPAGAYEAKVAVNQSWNENYGDQGAPGGANILFT